MQIRLVSELKMNRQPKVVSAENLTVGYKGKTVWKDANFSVDRGEFVAVIGPNGAGKTTMFRLLLGLQQPIAGTIKVFDTKPRRGNPKIGYIPQRHTIDSETNIECAELVRLAFSGNKWGFNLSRGEEKKVDLTRWPQSGNRIGE